MKWLAVTYSLQGGIAGAEHLLRGGRGWDAPELLGAAGMKQ